ncbi:hypothetical protein EST35_0084 [Pseudomonas phage vB_PaeM_PA5oct]|uniref:Uncharacterized protein n=1 Tax=Pseudomonas phage vB_PaeM_PA5oct TaxID=2163605 RepID=A0A4Y5JTA4_9CAUD|nr:hypothetical protein PQE65_gp399 [Pseudomonas phage vB_PaeM_PA5oct]QCG75966.1 hypothetical protein EST35_0084 [Pseudomonas phage vB_PaeM_PA5oct]
MLFDNKSIISKRHYPLYNGFNIFRCSVGCIYFSYDKMSFIHDIFMQTISLFLTTLLLFLLITPLYYIGLKNPVNITTFVSCLIITILITSYYFMSVLTYIFCITVQSIIYKRKK